MNKIETHFWKNSIFHAVQGTKRSWAMKQEHLSPKYTTQWAEIPQIKI
jgi:DNA polymerase V